MSYLNKTYSTTQNKSYSSARLDKTAGRTTEWGHDTTRGTTTLGNKTPPLMTPPSASFPPFHGKETWCSAGDTAVNCRGTRPPAPLRQLLVAQTKKSEKHRREREDFFLNRDYTKIRQNHDKMGELSGRSSDGATYRIPQAKKKTRRKDDLRARAHPLRPPRLT